MLAILTMGVVCASDNATDAVNVVEDVDDVSAANDVDEISMDESIDEAAATEEETPLAAGNVSVTMEDTAWVDWSESYVAIIKDSDGINGTVTVVIDNNDTFEKSFYGNSSLYYLRLDDFNQIPTVGLHMINVTYLKNGSGISYNGFGDVDFTYTFFANIDDVDGENDDDPAYFNRDLKLIYYVPADAQGKFNLIFNNKKYTTAVKNGYGVFNIPAKELKVGFANISCTFVSSTDKYPQKTIERRYFIEPVITYVSEMAVGEKDTIDILSSKNTKINIELWDHNAKKILANYSFNGGEFSIPLDKFVVKGENWFDILFKFDDDFVIRWAHIYGYANSKGFKASVSAKANLATIKVTGPKIKSNVKIYVDNKLVKSASLKKGSVKYTISKLSLAKHRVKVLFKSGDKFFSKTFSVNSKFSLTLKTVKVKKSAKKLVLSATVKTTKKSQKGLKVTFKFRGKTYKAKTDKKGVAKATVKKSVLKKLKVGKKVTYQVTYSKYAIKKSAKVKK
jgi:hypothetical protein